jgi:TrmH family RNA methyltransferase
MPINDFTDYTIIGADQKGNPMQSLGKTPEQWILVMGSEAHGISKDIKSSLNQLVAIPKIGSGESLNVGVSMGILLHHLTK